MYFPIYQKRVPDVGQVPCKAEGRLGEPERSACIRAKYGKACFSLFNRSGCIYSVGEKVHVKPEKSPEIITANLLPPFEETVTVSCVAKAAGIRTRHEKS